MLLTVESLGQREERGVELGNNADSEAGVMPPPALLAEMGALDRHLPDLQRRSCRHQRRPLDAPRTVRCAQDTDRNAICALYDTLLAVQPTSVIELNRARERELLERARNPSPQGDRP